MKLNTKNLADVDISFPVIEDGTFHARITASIEENKKKTGNNLVLACELLDDLCKRDTGEPLNRSLTLKHYVSMVPTDNYDPDENYKKLADAIELPEGEDLELEALQGAVIKVQVGHKPASSNYREGNEIKSFYPKDADFIDPQM